VTENGISRRALLALAASAPAVAQGQRAADGFVDILREPDFVTAYLESGSTVALSLAGGRWSGKGVAVEATVRGASLPVRVEAADAPLMRVRLRWKARVPERWRIVNDQWERSYGDLEWRGMNAERVLPWMFLAFDGAATHGYGVETGASSFALWQVDTYGVSLWLDVRNGGGAVKLGPRVLEAATVRTRRGSAGESAFAAGRKFCATLCAKPRLAAEPVYGGNNWYYAYGRNCSATDIERDSDLMAELAGRAKNRPFMVIDDGWSPVNTAGPWDRGNARFADMAKLAASMKKRGVRPGIWVRPLLTSAKVAESWKLRGTGLDPTVPEAMELVRTDIARLRQWGYELVKHDYSSYDLMGRWGLSMGAELTDRGWHFADRSKTTAEVVLGLYRGIREAAENVLVIGCNTFGHLAAGLVEVQRTGDDTSGREFHRTRRMGVNTLAFRGPQHRTFFDLDADCAPITPQVPWEMSARWLDLVARSGTALFVSPDPRAVNAEVKAALRKAFAEASVRREVAEPLDWMETTTPSRWRIDGRTVEYDWYGDEGGTPFPK
jgi:alpha-galactosidase